MYPNLHRLVDSHIQYVGNALALVAHLQCLAVVAFAVAHLARHKNVGQEVHLDGLVAIALARLAASALDVEGESARLITTNLGFGQGHKQRAYVGEDAGIGSRVGTGRTTERRLVDINHLIYIIKAFHPVVWHRLL